MLADSVSDLTSDAMYYCLPLLSLTDFPATTNFTLLDLPTGHVDQPVLAMQAAQQGVWGDWGA